MTATTTRKIARAARRLLNREGAEGVTMRRVASAVGITPMALYRHYPNRGGLLNALSDEGFVELAAKYQSEVWVFHDGNEFNGKSILDLTSVAAECGSRLELEARGPDAEEAVEALAALIAARFHEEGEANPDKEPAP